VSTDRVVDPTGCGDAYRAGFLYGVGSGQPLDVAGRIGSVFGACQVEVQGTQVLKLDQGGLRARYEQAFGSGF
jgi:adenosine kinase